MPPGDTPSVLHVCQSDTEGGAAIAARRLHDALIGIGVDSRMMVIDRQSDDPRIDAPLGRRGRARVRAARFVAKRIGRLGAAYDPGAMRSLGIVQTGLGAAIERAGADIVHLHWVGGETMSLNEIAGIRAPLVWTMHDYWAFSGAHHFGVPGEGRRAMDVDRWMQRRKARIWQDLDPVFVCPSDWTSERLAESGAFPRARRMTIYNTVDVEAFAPVDRQVARASLGLPGEGPLLLFGAVGGARDDRKGGDLLVEVMQILHARGVRVSLAVFGGPPPDGLPQPAVSLGVLHGAALLATAYSAADVFVCPSRMESFPNTIVEAQCCGTPAVGFASAGQAEAIGAPGRLAPPFDCERLATIIEEMVVATPERLRIRADMVSRVAPDVIARRHADVYSDLLANGRGT